MVLVRLLAANRESALGSDIARRFKDDAGMPTFGLMFEMITPDWVDERRLSFGQAAQRYDAIRPLYPTALIDDVVAHVEPGLERALEVGAGTGQATRQFGDRGIWVDAIEPDAEMAAVARKHVDSGAVLGTVTESDFERLDLSERENSYDLFYAATCWHWIDPAVRLKQVRRALRPGGTAAVFWSLPLWRRTELQSQFDAVYRSSGAPLEQMGPLLTIEPDPGALAREWRRELAECGGFRDLSARRYDWQMTYDAAEYVTLLNTFGDHIALEPEVGARLAHGITEIIARCGGTITLPWVSVLLLARSTS